MPPEYSNYPKIPEITKAINASELSSVKLKEGEVGQIMDLLCWDGRVMRVMGGQAFMTVCPLTKGEEKGNGLAESVCSCCPVFDLCEEGGPVNARTCTYFREWLEN